MIERFKLIVIKKGSKLIGNKNLTNSTNYLDWKKQYNWCVGYVKFYLACKNEIEDEAITSIDIDSNGVYWLWLNIRIGFNRHLML